MNADMPIFDVRDLSKKFGSTYAVDHVSVQIRHGEAVFVVGPSGSGKSTFLRCLNLMEQPTSGEIYFKGTRLPPSWPRSYQSL